MAAGSESGCQPYFFFLGGKIEIAVLGSRLGLQDTGSAAVALAWSECAVPVQYGLCTTLHKVVHLRDFAEMNVVSEITTYNLRYRVDAQLCTKLCMARIAPGLHFQTKPMPPLHSPCPVDPDSALIRQFQFSRQEKKIRMAPTLATWPPGLKEISKGARRTQLYSL